MTFYVDDHTLYVQSNSGHFEGEHVGKALPL